MALQVLKDTAIMVRDTAISHTVQEALNKALSCLQNGFELFLGAQNHLVKIRDSLKEIRDFIVIAEGSPIKDHKLMELLEKLKDAAYDAQDLLEEYEIADRRRSDEAENNMPVRDAMTNRVHRVVTSLVTITPVIKLRELSQRLKDIKAECDTFQLKEKVTKFENEFKKTRDTHSFVPQSQVIGRDREKEEIVTTFLLSTELDDVSVIAIVGVGGLGKTTLAQLVFNHDDEVKNHFALKLWICVSDNLEPENFDSIKLGNKILERATCDRRYISDLVALQRRLQEKLGGKRFLLVLDDVWNENSEKWRGKNGLRDLLLCGGKGSRIVVTTRSQNVAFIMSKIQPYILKSLSEDDCWSLFCQSAFGNSIEEAAHPNLAAIGREIVKKCQGIPLAVTTLGGLLYDKRSESRWKSVRDSEMWSLPEQTENGILPTKQTENGILPALRLSYNYLRLHLKQCFAFCAIFPQDYEIEKELVIKLWMANGFIPIGQEGLMELEDIGNEIFDELVMRSFFQDVKENVTVYDLCMIIPDQTTFRMHDVMHDLAHSVMENEYHVVLNGKSKDISPRIRHVSFHGFGILSASFSKAQMQSKAQMLRTYVMLRFADFQFPCDVGLFKCLRALDFRYQRDNQEVVRQLHTSLGNLQHLRYLDLSHTLIEMLPESLTSLCYLQTLKLIHCTELCELPKEIRKLTNLRCLDITDCYKLTHMPPKLGQLSCLQELSDFIVGRTNEIACSGIGELQGLNLRGRLTIRLLNNITDAIDVPRDTLINKPNLTSLNLMWEVRFDTLKEARKRAVLEQPVLQGLQPHRNLKKLQIFLYGGFNFPRWMMDTTVTELVEITLSRCWRCNHLPPLGELPFLKVLKINGLKNVKCIGKEFYGNEVLGGFPSLKELHISGMQKLKTWSGLEWKGKRVFPSLNRLYIENCLMLTTVVFFPDIKDLNVDQGMVQNLGLSRCHGLKSLPEQIGNLTSHQELVICNCPKMASLPRELQRFSTLKELFIDGCPTLEIRCTKDTGEDWDKIQHIPHIWIGGHHIARD